MELPQRKGEDRFLPAGHYKALQDTIRLSGKLNDVSSLVVSAFDRRTRMFPFVNFDWYTVPCGPRSIAGALYDAGMQKTRFSFQLWNPNLRPSQARIDGRPIDMLLVSSMQVHSAASYELIEEAWTMGDQRPLILAGGPKACYQPFHYFGLGPNRNIGADVVVTGEEPVLMELLSILKDFGAGPGSMRQAFNRARQAGALQEIPGLVFPLDDRHDGENLTNTGIQKLLKDLDELPMPSGGFRTLEPPHRGKTLSRETFPLHKAGGGQMVTTLLITRGCKFNCHYCPIPAYNQRYYRRKSPQRVVEEFIDCRRAINTRYVFGADDNFFNNRKYVEETIHLLASTQYEGKALGRQVRFGTEVTVIDAYKNRDLFPIARRNRAGITALWMGVEDLAGNLIDKGQAPEMTRELFADMLANDICPMVMMMHHDHQPLRTPGELTGLIDQMKFLYNAGAVGMQCTLANPAYGSRWMTDVFDNNVLYRKVGNKVLTDLEYDGNHIIASVHKQPWKMQLNMLRGYAAFYNPWNFLRAIRTPKRTIRNKKLFYQVWGMATLVRTAWRLKGHLWRLWRGPIERFTDWPEQCRKPGTPYPDLLPKDQPTSGSFSTTDSKFTTLPPAVAKDKSKTSV